MQLITDMAIGLVAVLHLAFMVLEMLLWDTPFGRRIFGLSESFAQQSRTLAANQGLYNGFLAAGLIWALLLGPAGGLLAVFFLVCVVIAGVFGALTVKRSILFIQALPGVVALGLLLGSA